MLTLHDVAQVAEAQRRFPNWIIWAVILVAIAWAIGTAVHAFPWQAAGSPAVQQEQQVQVGPAPAESNSAPAQTEPIEQPVASAPAISGPTHVNWVKIGEARNGEQVLALPIPWDQVIRDIAKADLRIVSWLDQVNRPDSYWGPGKGSLIGYLITDENIVIYGLSSRGGDGADYWKTEVKLSELEGLRP